MNAKVSLYSAVDDELTHYEVDVAQAALDKRNSVKLPANAQYAWPHPTRRYLYVATSNRGAGLKSDFNHLSAFRIDPESGALRPHGEPRTMPQRAVHTCLDASGRYALSAHNLPTTGITVHRIEPDGTVGAQVPQTQALDYGIYPHQIMITPSNRTVILVDRGNSATQQEPEDPGALRSFGFDEGLLTPRGCVAPNGGYGFGPRHLDFHQTKPWVYVSLERQSKLHVFRMPGDTLEPEPAFVRETLADPANIKPRQLAGAIHLHPNGRFVYVMNRADWTVDYQGRQVFNGGENSIAVYAIDQDSGEPTLIQHADTHAFHVRTFSLDPGGRVLVAASIKPLAVRDGNNVTPVPAALSVFRVGTDGRLEFARKYDVETASGTQYWTGMVGAP